MQHATTCAVVLRRVASQKSPTLSGAPAASARRRRDSMYGPMPVTSVSGDAALRRWDCKARSTRRAPSAWLRLLLLSCGEKKSSALASTHVRLVTFCGLPTHTSPCRRSAWWHPILPPLPTWRRSGPWPSSPCGSTSCAAPRPPLAAQTKASLQRGRVARADAPLAARVAQRRYHPGPRRVHALPGAVRRGADPHHPPVRPPIPRVVHRDVAHASAEPHVPALPSASLPARDGRVTESDRITCAASS